MRKRVATAYLLVTSLTVSCNECAEELFAPEDGTVTLGLGVSQPVDRTLVHETSVLLEGFVTGAVVHEVVYSLNGGTEISVMAGEGVGDFRATVLNLTPGLNELTVTARGEDVTYDAGELTGRVDAEVIITNLVYYSDEPGAVLAKVVPDTVRIPQIQLPLEDITVWYDFFATVDHQPNLTGTPNQVIVSGLPPGLVRSGLLGDLCKSRACRLFLEREGPPLTLGHYPVEVDVHLDGDVATDTLHLIVEAQESCEAFAMDPRELDYVNRGASYRTVVGFSWNRQYRGDVRLAMDGNGVFENMTFQPNPIPEDSLQAMVGFDVLAGASLGPATLSLRGARPNFEAPISVCEVPFTTTVEPADLQRPEIVVNSPAGESEVLEDSIFVEGTVVDHPDGGVPPSGVDSMVYSLNGGPLVSMSRSMRGETVGAAGEISREWGVWVRELTAGIDSIWFRAWDRGGNLKEIPLALREGGSSGACSAFNLRLDADTVQIASNGASELTVFVDRSTGFDEQVELTLEGTMFPPEEVFSSYGFDTNPVLAGGTYSTLLLALIPGWSPGNRWTFALRGGSPQLEDLLEECLIPVTFEVVTP